MSGKAERDLSPIADVITELTDEQLIDDLLRYSPPEGKEVLRLDFASSIGRFRQIFEAIPLAKGNNSLLDIGGRLYTASIYCNRLGYRRVCIGTKWKTPWTGEDILSKIENSDRIEIQYFDAEQDVFPYDDNQHDVVVCSEVLEHLALDPMHMMSEINRVTRIGGLIILTTPNAASLDALKRVMSGKHPYSWSPYNGTSYDRHNREYTVTESMRLLDDSGFDVMKCETLFSCPPSLKDRVLVRWISFPDVLRDKPGLNLAVMGQTSFIIGRKGSQVRSRFPSWLYYDAKRGT